jgi:hypothetical protein
MLKVFHLSSSGMGTLRGRQFPWYFDLSSGEVSTDLAHEKCDFGSVLVHQNIMRDEYEWGAPPLSDHDEASPMAMSRSSVTVRCRRENEGAGVSFLYFRMCRNHGGLLRDISSLAMKALNSGSGEFFWGEKPTSPA